MSSNGRNSTLVPLASACATAHAAPGGVATRTARSDRRPAGSGGFSGHGDTRAEPSAA